MGSIQLARIFFSGNNFCGNGFFGGETSFSGRFNYGIHTHIYYMR